MSGRAPWWLRRLAALLVRGPEAPFVLVDLDDAFDREVARGMTRARAICRYLVNTCLSSLQLLRDRFRQSSIRLSWIDVRLGVRMLIKYPTLTMVALFALTIALPVCLAPMHMALAVESTLPEDPDGRLRLLRLVHGTTNVNDLARWRHALSSFDRLAGVRQASYNLDLDGSVVSVQGAEVSASIFPMLGTAPALGRTFASADEAPGAEPVVIIGHQLWHSRFDARPDVTDRRVSVGGVPHRVVGVMPEGFYFPSRQQAWLPLRDQPTFSRDRARSLWIIAHLGDDVSDDAAQAEFTAVALAGVTTEPGEHLVPEIVPTSFMGRDGLPKGGFRATPEFYIAQVLTVVPLLIACLNVGLLIFARTATRASEFAVRTALGASRSRILTQVFTESFVLVLLATGVGLWLLDWVPARGLTMAGVTLPYWIDTGVTVPIVVGGLLLGVVAAGVAGVIPVLRSTSQSVQATLQQKAGRSGVRFGKLSTVLIVADVAAAVAVIGLAVAVGRQVEKTIANEGSDGITAARYLSFSLQRSTMFDGASADDSQTALVARMAATQDALVTRLKAEPGVRGVAVGSVLPRMEHPNARIEVADVDGSSRPARARWAQVDPDFFVELHQPVLAGRGFTAADLSPSAHTVIVNTSFVANVLDGRNPIGQRVRFVNTAESGPWLEIIGVVGHLGMRAINAELDTGIYRPLRPGALQHVRVAIEVGADPLSFVPRVRQIASNVDPQAIVTAFAPLNEVYEGDWYVMAAAVAGGLVLVGVLLTLAVSAIYAIMAFTVAQRTREIGVRIALGADRMQVVMQVVRRAFFQIAAGVLLGMLLTGTVFFEMLRDSNPAGSAGLAAILSLLPGVAILVVIALVSCAAPTLRALRISPVEALRNDG